MTMDTKDGRCATICWIVAIVVGVLAFALMRPGVWVLLALLVAVLVTIAVGVMLSRQVCTATARRDSGADEVSADAVAAPQGAPAPGSRGSAALAQPGSGGAASGMAAGAAHPGASGASEVEATPTARPGLMVPPDDETAEWDEAQESGSTVTTSAAAYDAGPADEDDDAAEEADDLRRLQGVGPKVAETLERIGIRRFDQIAAWTEVDMERLEAAQAGLRARAERDDWIGQARALAAGRNE